MTEDNELLKAVKALTDTTMTKVLQENEAGIKCVSVVTQEPLLARLRASVVGGIGSHAGSSSASERLPFDAGALALYTKIENTISQWFVDLTGKPIYLAPERTLTNWLVAFEKAYRAGNVPEFTLLNRVQTLQGWAFQIEGKFQPHKKLELTVAVKEPVMVPKVKYRTDDDGYRVPEPVLDDNGQPVMQQKTHWKTKRPIERVVKRQPAACPSCDQRYAYNPENGDKILALILEYREEGENTIDNAAVTCRACETTWVGSTGVRFVSHAIGVEEEIENLRHAGTVPALEEPADVAQ